MTIERGYKDARGRGLRDKINYPVKFAGFIVKPRGYWTDPAKVKTIYSGVC
jgi:hypothetical protein